MAKYLLVYHGGGMPESEAEGERVMAAWGAWFGRLGAAVVDGGAPVGDACTLAADGTVSPDAGANPATGYSLIEAESLAEATERARGCPILDSGGSIEVCATLEM